MKISMKKLATKIANFSRTEKYITELLPYTRASKCWVNTVNTEKVSVWANSRTKYMIVISKEADGMIDIFKLKEEV